MSTNSFPQGLTVEQEETLEQAAFSVISARTDAAETLRRAGVEVPPDSEWFGNPCGVGGCPCSDYSGRGGACVTRTTTSTGTHRTCGHKASQHLPT